MDLLNYMAKKYKDETIQKQFEMFKQLVWGRIGIIALITGVATLMNPEVMIFYLWPVLGGLFLALTLFAIVFSNTFIKFESKIKEELYIECQEAKFYFGLNIKVPWGNGREYVFSGIESVKEIKLDPTKIHLLKSFEEYQQTKERIEEHINMSKRLGCRMPIPKSLLFHKKASVPQLENKSSIDPSYYDNIEKYRDSIENLYADYKEGHITREKLQEQYKEIIAEYKIVDITRVSESPPDFIDVSAMGEEVDMEELNGRLTVLSTKLQEIEKRELVINNNNKEESIVEVCENPLIVMEEGDKNKEAFAYVENPSKIEDKIKDRVPLSEEDIAFIKDLKGYVLNYTDPQFLSHSTTPQYRCIVLFKGDFSDVFDAIPKPGTYRNFRVTVPQLEGTAVFYFYNDPHTLVVHLKDTESMGTHDLDVAFEAKHIDAAQKLVYRNMLNEASTEMEEADLTLLELQARNEMLYKKNSLLMQALALGSLENAKFEREKEVILPKNEGTVISSNNNKYYYAIAIVLTIIVLIALGFFIMGGASNPPIEGEVKTAIQLIKNVRGS